ncbi:MAG: tol-pal system protein YbgF [Alphaproteobacteria bacterium]|nr:tol-pal system protein YbgF [Alphaproteobacteria bacterium]
MKSRPKLLTTAALATVFALSFAPAWSADVDDLEHKLDRVERDLRELQYDVHKGNPPERSGGLAGGPPGGVSGGGARLNDMEQSLRELRGQVETLSFQVKQMTEQLDIARKESNYRLGALEGGAPASAFPAPGGPGASTALPSQKAAPPVALTRGGSNQAGRAPGMLGSIPADAAVSETAGASPQQQYDDAMDLLSRAQYAEAQGAFRKFVAANPADQLAGPAQFWVGDIAFTQKDYQGSAKSFADVLKRYSKTAKAPEAMLKLGLSLIELGQKKEGCTTLGALKVKYPTAAKPLVDRAAKRSAEAGCGK